MTYEEFKKFHKDRENQLDYICCQADSLYEKISNSFKELFAEAIKDGILHIYTKGSELQIEALLLDLDDYADWLDRYNATRKMYSKYNKLQKELRLCEKRITDAFSGYLNTVTTVLDFVIMELRFKMGVYSIQSKFGFDEVGKYYSVSYGNLNSVYEDIIRNYKSSIEKVRFQYGLYIDAPVKLYHLIAPSKDVQLFLTPSNLRELAYLKNSFSNDKVVKYTAYSKAGKDGYTITYKKMTFHVNAGTTETELITLKGNNILKFIALELSDFTYKYADYVGKITYQEEYY